MSVTSSYKQVSAVALVICVVEERLEQAIFSSFVHRNVRSRNIEQWTASRSFLQLKYHLCTPLELLKIVVLVYL